MHDPGATLWLQRAIKSLESEAAKITDERMRQDFLGNIPHHRVLAAAWSVLRTPAKP